jgi:hypothetical protein
VGRQADYFRSGLTNTARLSDKSTHNVKYRVPNLKEYFQDLEYILGVISDGPAKSYAYRRIKYLESRWDLYCLLNEYQELAEMKVRVHLLEAWFRMPDLQSPACSASRLLQCQKGRYTRPSLGLYEPKASIALHQVQDEAESR